MTILKKWTNSCGLLIGLVLFSVGCEQPGNAPVTTDMHEDADHDHPHSHGHRHGEPLHGGRITPIGHSHHEAGATHFHAEVMPVTDNQIVFYLLTESADGDSQEHPIDTSQVTAYVNKDGADPAQARELTFLGAEDGPTAKFQAAIPDPFTQCRRLSIVVPKITLGDERLNFSFKATRPESANDTDAAAAHEEPPL